MSAHEYRYAHYACVHDSFTYLNSKHFKKFADEGYIDLDEPDQRETQSGMEYNNWIHDAWRDFIIKMNRSKERPTIQLGDDLQAHCSTRLSGCYYGKTICTNTFITFRYVKIQGLEDVYQWKAKLDPVHFMRTLSTPGASMTCSCILKCCCINQRKIDDRGILKKTGPMKVN